KALLGDSYVRGFLWTKMIRRKFLLGGFAVKGNDALFEDTCLSVFAFCQASTFVYAPETLYRYTQEEGASAVRKPRTNRSQYHLAAFASIRLYLQKEHPELLPVFFGAKFRSYWSLWYDHTQDRKYGVSRKEIARYKKEFADIFNPSKPLDIQGTSYSEKVGEAL
ncbi:MAG: hypothetical protein K6E59_02440, partial [Bacilli bacterium]|nr:hypothetical protein [Bacilli bacterium]